MSKTIGFSAVFTLAVMTITTARPQETATEDLEGILQTDASSNAVDPLASVIDTGLQYGEETTGYEGQGTEITTVTDVLELSTESNGSPTEIFSHESQELPNLLSSTHQASKLNPNFEDSPFLPALNVSPFYAEEVSPLPPPYVAVPSSPTQDVSQPLYPAYGVSPLFPFAIPTFERDQTLLSGNQTNSPIGSRKRTFVHLSFKTKTNENGEAPNVLNNQFWLIVSCL